jgi:hypothetical protein
MSLAMPEAAFAILVKPKIPATRATMKKVKDHISITLPSLTQIGKYTLFR